MSSKAVNSGANTQPTSTYFTPAAADNSGGLPGAAPTMTIQNTQTMQIQQNDLDSTPLQPAGGMQFLGEYPQLSAQQIGKRRLLALSIAVPIAVVLAAAGIYLLVLQIWSMTSRGEVEKSNLSGAISGYSTQLQLSSLTPLEWVANYNLGTAYLLDGQVDLAITYLESALDEVPKAQRDEENLIQYFSYECAVRENLSAAYSVNGQADLAQEMIAVCLWSESEGDSSGLGSESESDSSTDEQESQDNQGEDGQDSGEQSEQSDNGQDEANTSEDDVYGDETEEERERREQLENKNQQHSEEQQANDEEKNAGGSNRRGW